MDNDGALLEVLRNTYKGLRFRWKYRGLIILPAEQGNAAAADAIRAGQPLPEHGPRLLRPEQAHAQQQAEPRQKAAERTLHNGAMRPGHSGARDSIHWLWQ